ncbi:preprotein translocase subunit SecE [Longimicrobium terrae]|jgi:preprotein translocase subunit SecE|uniref:Protein translocase subunit SecE n=1 Tax=Longimicrobium terrae TaxID=1639882 RepID=A0A841GWK2_9BACT|nr:preprotein translocase subunit SecE [Longimicrobium terrae]MBB4634424.1 preprotein translocase subunit SecE [Longimicrobium terrae]MBB6068686.1 preprotein translocase subunit SecE [Longimicrobium terrae]NNC27872.1 preprotein translocase subunit SecE [Longimicrobium terrae]
MAETTRSSTRDFFPEVVEQVKKVTWPDRAQLQNSTGIIVAFMFAMAAITFVIDFGIRNLLEVLTSLFAG